MTSFENYFVILISALGMILYVRGNEHQAFYNQMFKLHNHYRNKHGANPLIMHEQLSDEAMDIAKNWINTNENSVVENSNCGYNFYAITYANNFFAVYNTDLTALRIFFDWYSGCQLYNYKIEPPNRNADFCTQILWKQSRFLGLAKLKVGNRTVVVAKYFPAGNIIGQYTQNVGPPQT